MLPECAPVWLSDLWKLICKGASDLRDIVVGLAIASVAFNRCLVVAALFRVVSPATVAAGCAADHYCGNSTLQDIRIWYYRDVAIVTNAGHIGMFFNSLLQFTMVCMHAVTEQSWFEGIIIYGWRSIPVYCLLSVPYGSHIYRGTPR